jgi:hypothetical protein
LFDYAPINEEFSCLVLEIFPKREINSMPEVEGSHGEMTNQSDAQFEYGFCLEHGIGAANRVMANTYFSMSLLLGNVDVMVFSCCGTRPDDLHHTRPGVKSDEQAISISRSVGWSKFLKYHHILTELE